MEILFLGTSSGTPTKTRNVAALAIRMPETRAWYLVDCGEGTQHRLLHTRLSLLDLEAIFITHIHGDHCYGLPGLLASAGMLNRTKSLLLAGPPAVRDFVQAVMKTTQLWLPYPLEYVNVEEAPSISLLQDAQVQTTPLSHRVPSFAYSFSEKALRRKLDIAKLKEADIPAGPAWNHIQQGKDEILPDGRTIHARDYLLAPRKPRKIIVGGDNDTPALLAAEASDADVLIHEATYTDEVLSQVGSAPRHSSARMVAQFAQDAGIANLVLTHFSPRYQERKGEAASPLEAEARRFYTGKLFMASDWDRYLLDRHGSLDRMN